MGKRKVVSSSSSSENEDEKSNRPENSPKKQINHFNQLLLQTANMNSKKQLLQKGLKNSDVQRILNKNRGEKKTKSLNNSSKQNSFQNENSSSSANEDQDDMKRTIPETKINVKEEISRKHVDSSSYESSSLDDTFVFNIKKKEKKSKSINGDLTSEGSESDGSDSGEGKNMSKYRVKPVLQTIKKKVSSSENESDSEASNKKIELIQKPKIKKKESSSSESESDSVSDNEKRNFVQIQQNIGKRDSDSSESESESILNNKKGEIVSTKNINKNNASSETKYKKSNSSESDADSDSDNEKREVIPKKSIVKKNNSYLNVKNKNPSSSESESDDLTESEEKKKIANIKKEIKTSSSSSDSDIEDKEIITNSVQIHKRKSLEDNSSSSEDEETGKMNHSIEKLDKNKGQKKSLEHGIKREKNKQNKLESQSSLDSNNITEKLEKTLKNRKSKSKSSDSDSDASTKSRVKILQNVRLNPQTKDSTKDSKELLQIRYPGIQQTKTNIELPCSGSEDFYLFRMPKNVDPNLLLYAEVDFKNEFKINVGEKYNIKPTTKIPDPTLVVSDNCKVIHFKSNFIMEKHIKSKKDPKIVVPEKQTVPLPDNLKNRHPLFGSDFENKITLSATIEKKLDEAIANMLKNEEKKERKRNKHKKKQAEREDAKQQIFQILNSHSSVKRLNKDTSEDSAFSSSGSIDKIGKKNKRRQALLNEVLNDIKTEYDSASPGNKFSKRKRKHSAVDSEGEEKPKAKIKKEVDVSNIKTEVDAATLSKREKNRLSMANSTLYSDISKLPAFDPEISDIDLGASTSEKKAKKVKRKKDDSIKSLPPQNKMISEILDDLKDNIHLSPKAKKKKKQAELDI